MDRSAFAGDSRQFLFVQSTTEVGGAESMLLNLFANSEELRRRAVIASLGFGGGDLPARLRGAGATVIELPKARLREPLSLVKTIAALRQVVRARGIKVVVGNGAHPQVIGSLAARASGAKSVFLVNMIHHYPLWKNEPIDVLALRSPCDLLLAISKDTQANMARLRPRVECRLFHWGTPIVEVTAEATRQARAELDVAEGEVLLGSFGRVQRWKGQDVFVAAAARVARARPNTKFVVVGGSVFGLEPEFLEGLKSEALRQGLGDRIRFTGFRSDVPRLMKACDIVCHTTRVPEPFGLVIVEAMAQARPVIATRGGGPSEIIVPDQNGILIEPDDPDALAEAMIQLVDAPELRRTQGDRGAAVVRERFAIDTVARTLTDHLDSLSR